MLKRNFLIVCALLMTMGCSDNQTNNDTNSVWEQKGDMLLNWADNFIIPGYANLSSDLDALSVSIGNFSNDPSNANLYQVREKWFSAYKSWQKVEMFNIGPAELTYYNSKMNIFPTNTNLIEMYVEDGNADLSLSLSYAAQGFPALDFMLFGLESSDEAILNTYQNSSKHRSYLTKLIEAMVSNTQYINTEWVNYRSDFIASTENTATSSVNKMTNDFIYYYEKGFRANKFGIPAGRFSNTPFPSKVEAVYSGYSKELSLEALESIADFFNGNNLPSLKDFVDNNAVDTNANLTDLINAQFSSIEASITELNDNFKTQVSINSSQMMDTYDVIQHGTILLKIDMLSVLQIATDYMDADGD
jgi:hypothetical protein